MHKINAISWTLAIALLLVGSGAAHGQYGWRQPVLDSAGGAVDSGDGPYAGVVTLGQSSSTGAFDTGGGPYLGLFGFLGVTEVAVSPPVLTLLGANPLTLECGALYIEPGYEATDSEDGGLTGSVAITGDLDPATPGNYTLTYEVSDSDQNVATATRTVEVVDTAPPIITLNGNAAVTLDCQAAFSDPGATADDACEGALMGAITVTGSVDTAMPGTYTLDYNVADTAGNSAATVTRTVTVRDNCPGEGEGEGEGEPCPEDGWHTADQNQDYLIQLSELLRVIQFYNSDGLHCAADPMNTEDGFVPGPGADESCCPHASDYDPADWMVALSELLRTIQFYNSGGYSYCPGMSTEDGFCPGAP